MRRPDHCGPAGCSALPAPARRRAGVQAVSVGAHTALSPLYPLYALSPLSLLRSRYRPLLPLYPPLNRLAFLRLRPGRNYRATALSFRPRITTFGTMTFRRSDAVRLSGWRADDAGRSPGDQAGRDLHPGPPHRAAAVADRRAPGAAAWHGRGRAAGQDPALLGQHALLRGAAAQGARHVGNHPARPALVSHPLPRTAL
jgi:hypothetical protein